MAGAQVGIDLANSPSFEDKAVLEFFETSGRNLLAAEAAASVRHHVALSIVGTDRTPDSGYFRAKVAQEKLIETSGIPYTIIRSTQVLEFLGGIAASSADGNIVRISPGLFQPIAADDVAAIVAEVALAAPRNGIVEIAGPERAPFNDIVARYLKAVGDPREVVSDPEARYFGGRVEEKSLVPLGEAKVVRPGNQVTVIAWSAMVATALEAADKGFRAWRKVSAFDRSKVMRKAADLLREPGATIGSVADQVGYGSPFALSTAFKRVRGISPQEHRTRASDLSGTAA
jgi:hypothetical protein